MFLPWREFLRYVREHPTFPLNYRGRTDSVVHEVLFVNPEVHFSAWRVSPGASLYPDHPPDAHRTRHVWYWALMVILNVCQAYVANSTELPHGSPQLRRMWQFYAVRAPLAQLFYDFYVAHGRVATDDEIEQRIAVSPLPRVHFTHPDLQLNMPLTALEAATLPLWNETTIERLPPLFLAREALVSDGTMALSGELDAILAVEFGDALAYVRTNIPPQRRAELYAAHFKHFRMEDIEEHFYFEPESMTILFTCLYRINALYEVIRRITHKYGARVNIGAADMTAAQAGMASDVGGAAEPPPPPGASSTREARENQRMRRIFNAHDAILCESGSYAAQAKVPIPAMPPDAWRRTRYRRIVPQFIRRKLLFPLKEAITSHNALMLFIIGNLAWKDEVLLRPVGGHTHMGTWYERFYPYAHRAVGCHQLQEASTALEDCQFFTEDADPPGLFLRVNRAAFFDDPNMKIGVDAWGIPFKDVGDPDLILPETYMYGQHRAFIHWLATVSMTSMMGMYEHSSTVVPYAHMLKVQRSFSVTDATVVPLAKFFNQYQVLTRLWIKEHMMFQLGSNPVLRDQLEQAFPRLYNAFAVQAMVVTDDVRMLLSSKLRDDRARYEAFVVPLLGSTIVQRVKPKTRRKTDDTPIEALSAGKRTKRLIQQDHRDMCPVVNVPALDDIYALCQELIQYHRAKVPTPYHRQRHDAFFTYVTQLYLEMNQKPAHVQKSDVHKPLDMHVYRLVPHATRRAIDEYVDTQVRWGEPIDLLDLQQFGLPRAICEELESMREEFCGPVANKTSTKKLFDMAPLYQFTVYYFCAVVVQALSYHVVEVPSVAWKASQLQRIADSLGVSPAEVPPTMQDIVFSTRSNVLHVSLSILALGTKAVAHGYWTDRDYNVMKKIMTRRRQFPDRGLVRLSSLGRIIEFPYLIRTMKNFKRRAGKRNGDGGEGSARAHALRVAKAREEDVRGATCKVTTHDLHFLDVVVGREAITRDQAMLSTHRAERKLLGSRTAYPDRRPMFVVPETPLRADDWVKYDKKVRAVVRTDCCGTHARFSPAMFAGWARHPWVWCGDCPSAENNERFMLVCICCSDYASTQLHDKRVRLFDDRNDCENQFVICDQCHFLACDMFGRIRPTVSMLRRFVLQRDAVMRAYQRMPLADQLAYRHLFPSVY